MSGASAVTLEEAVAMGKTACDTCCSQANRIVYAVRGGQYYHYDNTCDVEDMDNATSGTLARALMTGFARCPQCVGEGSGSQEEEVTQTFESGTSGIKVYANRDGQYYHLTRSCAGSEASYITLETALNYGKRACPSCAASTAERIVWSTKGSDVFHIYRSHAPENATSGYLATAHAMGKEYCDVCLEAYRNDGTISESSDTFTPGTSGLYVYATRTGERFHLTQSCAGSEASRVALETALNYGKSPCPYCASIASTVVYATSSSRYYHLSQSCAGSDATAGYLAIARAMGKTRCPVCGGGSTSSGSSGGSTTSGSGDLSTATEFYIDLQGDSDSSLFHSHSTCSGAGMTYGSMVTEDFVRAQGFSPCPYCWD